MYITFDKIITPKQPKEKQLNFWEDDFILFDVTPQIANTIKTQRLTIEKDKNELKQFYLNHYQDSWQFIPKPPQWPISEINNHYSSFKIPKKSGGLRQIDAPDDELKLYLTNLKAYFENNLKILTHDCAHAYVKERSTITSLKVHQENKSNWFLKLDLKDFFPSHNIQYVLKTLSKIYPTCFLLENEEYKTNLTKALKYAFLDNKLPQGTPLSPTITNILMAPIDYQIQHALWNFKNDLIYTRYADDLLISSVYNFDFRKVENKIKEIFNKNEAPFQVKSEKTRYGSKSGQNWNLGIMLNKDNRMTIGHRENQRFRATIFSIMKDYTNSIIWNYDDKTTLAGKISYYKAVDPDYTNHVIESYENKFGLSLKMILK